MKIAAACVALLIAVILLASACVDYIDDANSAGERISREFSEIHNDAALNRDFDESRSRTNSEEIRAVSGAAFLTAGLFIFGTRKKAIT